MGNGFVYRNGEADCNDYLFYGVRSDDLGGCLPEEVFERPCEMWLVEVARFLHRIEDRQALLQKRHRPPSAINLKNCAVR